MNFWKWLWDNPDDKYKGEISRDTEWELLNGGQIQAWIKNELNSKYAVIRVTTDEETSYLQLFSTKEDESLYDTDPELYKDRVTIVPLPATGGQAGNDFVAMLSTTIPQNDLVITDQNLIIPFNFRAIRFVRGVASNEGALGTLVIQRSTDGGAFWDDVESLSNILRSSNPEDSTTTQDINLGQFLVNGKQLFRVRAFYKYEDQGEEKIMYSTWVNIGSSITKTDLKLILKTNYEQPIQSKDVNGNIQPFSVTYSVYGSVQKTLFLKIDNGSELKYDYDAFVDSIPQTVQVDGDQYLTHGIHKVEAWLECSNGLGEILKSNVLVNRLMVVNPDTPNANLTKPYLLLQNVDNEINNFVQTELAQYAVYSPSGENIELAFLLTDYTEDYESVKPVEYFRIETIAEPSKAYNLKTTIEIEGEGEAAESSKYDTYFRVRRISGSTDTDFMSESTNEKAYYILVDNSNQYTPVGGATFLLNPKVRNNNEDNPRRILNAKNNNAEVESVWTNFGFINDGWVTAEDGQKVLRIMAGSTLEIKKNVWAQFLTRPNSSMTFEIDCAIRNVTNTSDPIIKMYEGTATSFKGLKMNALEGWLMSGSSTNSDDCLFAWQEDVRTHFAINLNHQVVPNKGDVNYTAEEANKANGTLALARVFVNSDPAREMTYKTDATNEWCTSPNGSIIIGNEGADIDIYSIRIYEDKQIEGTDIINRNYPATLPTSEEKTAFKERNNLLEGGRISLEKAKNHGLNCMVWHGVLPYHANPAEQKGWYEYFRYDQDGNYLPEYSGTNCKETKSLSNKGQGSTAKTYYDWNQQDDNSKITATIQVPLNKIHSEIKVSAPYTAEDGKQYVDIYGGNLGKNAPIETPENAQPYLYSGGSVTVPDGWIDGNGMYRGMGYRVAEGTSLAQKKVIKINYASSMQSHLWGACKTYDLLHRKVVGATPLQQYIPTAVSAKHMEPFMFFNQEGNGNVYFKGMGTYGAGKADKVTWGYVKKQMPMYALIEGSDNNLPMTGFRVPFDEITAKYDVEGEGWLYNGQQSFDFDLGATDDNDIPKQEITNRWADIHNFIYLHGTNIKYYNGTFDAFKQSSKVTDTDYKYWCTQGAEAFVLKRYDFIGKEWIDAGLLVDGSYKKIYLNTESATKNAYNNWVTGGSGNYATLNEAFISAYVAHMRQYLKFFINEKSLQFNYCYVLGFLAGTDNSDKNTYYKIMPYAEKVDSDSEFTTWFSSHYGKAFDYSKIYQLYFDGDDMDSIFRTNNNSHQTKPYYIDRMHPYADDNPNECLYEGMGNQLFNYVEKAYEGTHELSSVMKQILNAATELVSDKDLLYGLKTEKISLWGFLHKYFFNIQYYFPQIAYMEQARIRYEFPKLLGFISSGGGARNIDPITQSLGSQLQNELQYMNQRVIYMTSYAGFGAWGGDTVHSIGLNDANEAFGFTPSSLSNGKGATYTFTVKPHQYIYPSYYNGQTFTQTHQRTSPKKTCTLTIAENVTTSDSGMGICGINYYSDLGDFVDISIRNKPLTITGKRLVKFTASWKDWNTFYPSELIVDAVNIRTVLIHPGNNPIKKVDASKLIRCNDLNVRGAIEEVLYPKSTILEKLYFPYDPISVELRELPNLKTIMILSGARMQRFFADGSVGKNTGLSLQSYVEKIYTDQKTSRKLESIHVENINWTDFPSDALEWYCGVPTCEFKGTIAINEDHPQGFPKITWDLKKKIAKKFGNVDTVKGDTHKGLILKYTKRDVNPDGLKIKGNFYVEAGDDFQFELVPSSKYENNFYILGYNLLVNGANATMNWGSGLMHVNSLSNTKIVCTIVGEVYWSETYGTSRVMRVNKNIEVWNRPVQVGDLVYADGTFSSPDSYEGEKTVVGRCCYVAPRKADGSINEKYHDPNDIMTRLMVACDNVSIPGFSSMMTTFQWGIRNFESHTDPSERETSTLYSEETQADGTVKKVNLSIDGGKTYLSEIPNVVNIDLRGQDSPSVMTSTLWDNSDEGVANNGFRAYKAETAYGDGFAYGEFEAYKQARRIGTSNTDLPKALLGEAYKDKADGVNLVNSGYAKTIRIIEHRNNIISYSESNTINGLRLPLMRPTAGDGKSELEALYQCMRSITEYAKSSEGLNDPNSGKWGQLYYPAVSACYAYEPKELMEGENLAVKFTAHHWFLPTMGLLARLWGCTYKYSSNGLTEREDNPLKTIYYNNKTVFKKLYSSQQWSVTEAQRSVSWMIYGENGSTYSTGKDWWLEARPVAAF